MKTDKCEDCAHYFPTCREHQLPCCQRAGECCQVHCDVERKESILVVCGPDAIDFTPRQPTSVPQ